MLLFSLFWRLLEQQDFAARIDDRVMRAVTMIEQDLTHTHSIEDLAAAVCLSVSQFKALFRKALGRSCTEYLTMRRMDRARTLLMNTDIPVRIVAYEVGYSDPSAFSRRFRFGYFIGKEEAWCRTKEQNQPDEGVPIAEPGEPPVETLPSNGSVANMAKG